MIDHDGELPYPLAGAEKEGTFTRSSLMLCGEEENEARPKKESLSLCANILIYDFVGTPLSSLKRFNFLRTQKKKKGLTFKWSKEEQVNVSSPLIISTCFKFYLTFQLAHSIQCIGPFSYTI